MGDIAEAFEQHLRSLSDTEWSALVDKVRPQNPPWNTATADPDKVGPIHRAADGLAEAERRYPRD